MSFGCKIPESLPTTITRAPTEKATNKAMCLADKVCFVASAILAAGFIAGVVVGAHCGLHPGLLTGAAVITTGAVATGVYVLSKNRERNKIENGEYRSCKEVNIWATAVSQKADELLKTLDSERDSTSSKFYISVQEHLSRTTGSTYSTYSPMTSHRDTVPSPETSQTDTE